TVPLPLARETAEGYSVFECLLAVPLDSKAAALPLRLVCGPEELYSASILTEQRTYPSQPLTVEQKYVTPDPSLTERIQQESRRNRAILASITPQCYWSLPLVRPVQGIITSEFGFRRILNGQPRSPHRGVDFRGAAGTPILACAAGKVVLAEEQYYSGNFMIIDHGLGVYSNYAHLSEFKSKVGDLVEAGQVIGLVGDTGRVTGPHLHFGLNVLGEAVTPESIMQNFRP
ncbi:MAG: M23 family metallopeptidase, partial [Deltaproteobacteria bacterium]|nr:M23 family metallopeptidase [Deltaproteobacteria bacterium]